MKKLLCLFGSLLLVGVLHAEQMVRVQLADGLKSAQIQISGKVYVYAESGGKKYKISKPQNLTVKLLSSGKLQLGKLTTEGPLILEPADKTQLTFQKNTYTGKFYFIPAGKTFQVVEHTDLEQYLLGVLPYEMSYSWPIEALKAQAVAARTYTRMQLKGEKSNFDLYNDVRSQMYKGSGKVYDSVREAVEGTAGQVLTYKGELFNTYYHANCGGGTDDAKIWTGSSAPTVKPLQGASCATDKDSKSYTWKATVPAASINKFINGKGLKGSIRKIKIAKQTGTKRAVSLQFTTGKGSQTLSCAQFRLSVGAGLLRSCKITSVSKSSGGFTFEGHGFGHGIGMCQDGTKGMAQNGKNYKQILENYFPSSTLTTL